MSYDKTHTFKDDETLEITNIVHEHNPKITHLELFSFPSVKLAG
jgi:hypothetical protein